MSGLLILRPPHDLRSGDDVLCARTIAGLNKAGLPAQGGELSSQWWASRLWSSSLPGRRMLFEYGPAFVQLLMHRRRLGDSSAVWINGPASLLNHNCWFERAILKSGQPYVFHLQDDWFSIPYNRAVAGPRVRLASLTVVPTEPLKQRIMGLFPDAKVLVLEEPIDVGRFKPAPVTSTSDLPFLVWTGHVASMADLKQYAAVLERVYARHPFKLRIISGQHQPALAASFPWEWFPFDPRREAELLSGAAAGLAPLEDSAYARCKGGYKVKTYLAAGLPIVASPVGHHNRLIQPGETGLLAATDDEWVDAIVRLLTDASLARRLSAAAREAAVSKYSHEVLMPEWAGQLRAALPGIAAV